MKMMEPLKGVNAMIENILLCPRVGELIAEEHKDRAAWLTSRSRGLGGSDIAGILGLSPWTTPLGIWQQKMGLAMDSEASWPMRVGIRMEQAIAEAWAEKAGAELIKMPQLTVADKPWMMASLDFVARYPDGRLEVIEIKWSSRGFDEVPAYYLTQVMWYMMITGIHAARLVVADPFHEPESHVIEWDPELAAQIEDAAAGWWERYIIGDIEPDPVSSDERKERAFSKLETLPMAVDADEKAIEIVERLTAAKTARDDADAAVKTIEAELAEHMVQVGASRLDAPKWSASFTERAGSIRYAEYVKAAGVPAETLEQYRGNPSRFLTVRMKGGKKE